MSAAQAVGLIHQACLGLAEVHARGVVHRDLKPANLWIEPSGNLKIIDFASARGFGEHALAGDNVTTQHVLVGTPQYAPPEQLYSPTLSTASDVYSLALILYELLSGHCAFWADRPRSEVVRSLEDDPVEWMNAHVKKVPVPLREHEACKNVPENLAELLASCLAKKPDDRPKDAGVLANSLGWVLHHELGAHAGRDLAGHRSERRDGLPHGSTGRASGRLRQGAPPAACASRATTSRGPCSSGRRGPSLQSCACWTPCGRYCSTATRSRRVRRFPQANQISLAQFSLRLTYPRT